MDLQLNDEALAQAFAARVLETLDGDTRDRVLTEAIKYVMTPPSGGSYYGVRYSPLQQAFNYALAELCTQLARDVVADDPAFTTQVRQHIAQAMTDVMSDARVNVLREKVTDALYSALYREGE